jgi:hypothetical protein
VIERLARFAGRNGSAFCLSCEDEHKAQQKDDPKSGVPQKSLRMPSTDDANSRSLLVKPDRQTFQSGNPYGLRSGVIGPDCNETGAIRNDDAQWQGDRDKKHPFHISAERPRSLSPSCLWHQSLLRRRNARIAEGIGIRSIGSLGILLLCRKQHIISSCAILKCDFGS